MRSFAAAILGALLLANTGCASSGQPYKARLPEAPTREPYDIAHRDGTFQSKDGKVTLYEQSWRPQTDPRAVIVVVHGLMDHSSRYEAFAFDALRRGYAVYAYDQRWHGRSSGERVWVDAFDDYLDDLDAYLKRVEAAEPNVPRFVLGFSMGGAVVTLDTIARHPKVNGLVLCGAALEIDAPGAKVFGVKVVATVAPRAAVFELDPDQFSRDPANVWGGRVDPLIFHDPAPAHTAKELIEAIGRIGERMEDVTPPILVMHGGADTVTPPHGSRELVRRARSTDKTLSIYDGLFHDLLREPERDRVSADVLDWVGHHLPPVR